MNGTCLFAGWCRDDKARENVLPFLSGHLDFALFYCHNMMKELELR